jgi:acetoin utilization protein AcuC
VSEPPCSAALVYADELLDYDFGKHHPMAPHRVELTMRLAAAFGVLDRVRVLAPDDIDDGALLRVHTRGYVDALIAASANPHGHYRHGLDNPDNPTFAGMHQASKRIAAASITAADLVSGGSYLHAGNLMGGLHHAMPDRASGFCIYNDAALAIARLLDAGHERVAYVDVDAHHGDGVERIFADDPRVLTISLHESPTTLFPGTGRSTDVGGHGAPGYAVNLPLAAGTGDADWLRAFDAVVPPLLTAFEPTVLVSQQGADAHALDPLTHLRLSVDGQRAAYHRLHDLAHRLSGGRWVLLGGGGYATVDVVPRAWTHLLAIASGDPLPDEAPLPDPYLDYVAGRFGRRGPETMGDGNHDEVRSVPAFDGGFDPADTTDQVILATRRAVFPYHGLDPLW